MSSELGSAGSGGTGGPWFTSEAYSALPTESFEWLSKYKSPVDALLGGYNAQKFIGVPPERVLKLPEKPDAPEWADIRARVGWKAPEKPEDYGLETPEGHPKEYAEAMAAAAHKLGVPKDALLALAAESNAAVQALAVQQDKLVAERMAAADGEVMRKYGAQYPELAELSAREAARLGFTPELVETLESTAARAAPDGILRFRTLLAELAIARKEAPLHMGATQMAAPTPEGARSRLAELSRNPEWAAKALERGTEEAIERLRLNALASGKAVSEDDLGKLARGIVPAA